MLDIAWPELVLIGAVALVAIGPKDLPKAMYAMGRWAGKARAFARDLHRAFEQVTYEAEVAENLKKAEPPKSGSPSPDNNHSPSPKSSPPEERGSGT